MVFPLYPAFNIQNKEINTIERINAMGTDFLYCLEFLPIKKNIETNTRDKKVKKISIILKSKKISISNLIIAIHIRENVTIMYILLFSSISGFLPNRKLLNTFLNDFIL